MIIDILTLFPNMFRGPFEESMLKRAVEKDLVEINIHDLRDWSIDKHNTVDDKPYGGGAGMVIRVDIVDSAIADLIKPKEENRKTHYLGNKGTQKWSLRSSTKVLLLSPQGEKYTQQKAAELSRFEHMILIAGHYEGFDERIRKHLVDEEISIGDYVLTGGELPAMVITDSIVRLIPGVLGDEESLADETHSKPGVKKYPVYTRPAEYKGWKVPEVLQSGNHAEIEKWKKEN